MPGAATLDTRTIEVAPGQEAALTVRIRNVGQVVDGFVVSLLGEPAEWSYADPPEVRLFPSTDSVVVVRFRPSGEKPPMAGPHPFAVRVQSREDPDWVVIEEATVQVAEVRNITASIRPKTSSGRRSGKHQLVIDNLGNTPAWVQIVPDDTDDLLSFRTDPTDVSLAPGTAALVDLKARLTGSPPSGTARVPFVVNVLADGQPAATTDAAFAPKKFPWKVVLALVALVIALLIAFMAFRRSEDVTSQAGSGGTGDTALPTTSVPGATTTVGGQETTTTAGNDGNNGGGGGPVSERLDSPQVLFASNQDGDFDIFIANQDGSNAEALTANGDFDGDPVVSPDGSKAVFVSGEQGGNTDLFLLDLEECNLGDLDTCEPEELTDTDDPEISPDWSPDSSTVVFARNVSFDSNDAATVNLELFSINAGSGDETQLTTRVGNESRPQFSPDGRTIAFEQTGRAGLDLALLDVASRRVSLVTLSPEPESGPHWLDGDTLAFVRVGGAQGDSVVEIDPAPTGGSTNERVLFTAPDVDLTAVSGDGGRIVFTSGTDLLIADRNGANQAPLSQGAELFQADLFEPN